MRNGGAELTFSRYGAPSTASHTPGRSALSTPQRSHGSTRGGDRRERHIPRRFSTPHPPLTLTHTQTATAPLHGHYALQATTQSAGAVSALYQRHSRAAPRSSDSPRLDAPADRRLGSGPTPAPPPPPGDATEPSGPLPEGTVDPGSDSDTATSAALAAHLSRKSPLKGAALWAAASYRSALRKANQQLGAAHFVVESDSFTETISGLAASRQTRRKRLVKKMAAEVDGGSAAGASSPTIHGEGSTRIRQRTRERR